MFRVLAWIILLSMPCKLASAQGIYLPTAGAVSRSMGGASTAAPVDAIGALYWNPASTAGLKHNELAFGVDALFADLEVASSFPGVGSGQTEDDGGPTPIPAIGWVHGLPDSNMTLGLGVFAVAGFQTNYPADAANPILAPQANVPGGLGGFGRVASEAQFLQMAPTLTLQLTDHLAIGGGPTVTLGKIAANPFAFAAPDDADGSGQARYPLSVSSRFHTGIGAQLGMYYTGMENLSLGAVIKSPQYMEQFRFLTQDEVGLPRYERLDVDLPMIISLGAAWHGDGSLLSLDVRYVDYDNADGFGSSGFNADGSLAGLNWKSVYTVVFGGRFDLSERLTWGIGYQYHPSPIDDADSGVNIETPLHQEHFLSTGVSYKLSECVAVHLAYAYVFDAEITGPIVTAATGPIVGTSVTNKLAAHFISMGVSVNY